MRGGKMPMKRDGASWRDGAGIDLMTFRVQQRTDFPRREEKFLEYFEDGDTKVSVILTSLGGS